MFLVGLTGGIATGKSAVAALFRERGIPVIDSDVIARQVVEPGTSAYCAIYHAFGAEYFHPRTEELQRKKLGALVFADIEKRKILNRIVHPEIRKQILKEALGYLVRGHPFVVVDVPLLFESKLNRYVHRVITVFCEKSTQLTRLINRDSCTREEALQRISSQMNLEEKMAQSDFLIDNNSAQLAELRAQVAQIAQSLSEDKFHLKIRVGLLLVITSFVGLVVKVGSYFWR